MNEHDGQLDERLQKLGDLFRSRPSTIEKGMRAIEQMPPAKPAGVFAFRPALARSGLGLAACLLLGVCLWLSLAGPANITLADVQKSINSKTWVLIQYDDGVQEWANLRERVSFSTGADADGRNFYAGMRDHVHGIWRCYHSNWGRQIHEEAFTPRPYPQTPWEYAGGDWDDRGIGRFSHTTVEKSSDSIDGREVVRFDTYHVGPSGLRALAQQVWADPQTRLPVRIRKYLGPDRGNKFNTGDFSFPESGPSSIHDLGAPRDLPVVVNWGVIEPAAKAIVDAATQAWRRLPRNMRIIKKSEYGLSISYRLGDKFRRETYGRTSPDHQTPLALDLPEDLEQIPAWAANHLTLVELCIYDGEYEYSYRTGEGLWDSSTEPGAALHVRQRTTEWTDVLVPLREQWPFISNVGPMKVLENEPGTPAGCVLLRYEGLNLRRDWYVDPGRDYICVKQLRFSVSAGQWVQERSEQAERTDLTRLPSGQWYAKTVHRPGTGILLAVTQLDVHLLSDSEVEQLAREAESTGFFDGKRLLEKTAAQGTTVTFWAR